MVLTISSEVGALYVINNYIQAVYKSSFLSSAFNELGVLLLLAHYYSRTSILGLHMRFIYIPCGCFETVVVYYMYIYTA